MFLGVNDREDFILPDVMPSGIRKVRIVSMGNSRGCLLEKHGGIVLLQSSDLIRRRVVRVGHESFHFHRYWSSLETTFPQRL